MPNTIEGMANYWKEFYNTAEGKGDPEGICRASHQDGSSSLTRYCMMTLAEQMQSMMDELISYQTS